MNRKKSQGSGGRATNSNPELCSTVPSNDANDAVEVGETAAVDKRVVALDEDGNQPDYLEMAWLLRDKLNDFVEVGKGGPPGLELRRLLNMAASHKIISVSSKKLSPVLWETLPKELVSRVLARLPFPDIPRLRLLSKEWNLDMVTVNSEINRALDEGSPTMVACLSFVNRSSKLEFLVTLYDLSTHRSHYSYRNRLVTSRWLGDGGVLLHGPGGLIRHETRWDDMGARDGGLVCFVSTWRPSKVYPLCIVVVNPLTRVHRKLPPLKYAYVAPPKMMDIKVDSATKCYRVVVVGRNIKGRPTVEIYDSSTRQWTKARPPLGFIFGLAYTWQLEKCSDTFRSLSITRSVYDFAEGQLKHCHEKGSSPLMKGASELEYVFQKDCLFVLHMNTSNVENDQAEGHCVTKYRMQSNGTDWVQERSYVCSPAEDFQSWTSELDDFISLEACEGFLMVLCYFSDIFWLLDLSTGEWSRLPVCSTEHEYETSMSRVFWNVVP